MRVSEIRVKRIRVNQGLGVYLHCVRRLSWSATTLDTLLQVHRSITAFARFSWYYYSFFSYCMHFDFSFFNSVQVLQFFLVLVLSLFSVWTVALHACCTNIRHHCKCSSHILSTNFQRTPFTWQMKIGQIFVCLLGHLQKRNAVNFVWIWILAYVLANATTRSYSHS